MNRGNTNLFHCEEMVDFIVVCVEKVEKRDLVYWEGRGHNIDKYALCELL